MHIRLITLDDAVALQKIASDPRVLALTNLPNPYPENGAIEFIQHTINNQSQNNKFIFAGIQKEQFIGLISIKANQSTTIDSYWSIDYIVSPNHWNKGLATTMISLVLDFSRKNLNIIGFRTYCLANNKGSCRALQKNDFVMDQVGLYQGPKAEHIGKKIFYFKKTFQ